MYVALAVSISDNLDSMLAKSSCRVGISTSYWFAPGALVLGFPVSSSSP